MLYITTYLRWLCVPMVIVATLAAGIALSACTDACNRSADEVFASAEALMEDRPDSALALLEAIDPHRLSGARRHALHALLLTQARDKNYIDETSDSLISIAVTYFDNSTDTYRRMLSHYYLSRVHYYGGNYVDAAREAEAALTALTADHENTGYWKGRIYHDLAILASETSNPILALDYNNEAIKIFDSIGNNYFKTDALLLSARNYIIVNDWNKLYNILNKFDWDSISEDQRLDYYDINLTTFIHEKNWDDARDLALNLKYNNPKFQWKAYEEAKLADIFAHTGDYFRSDTCLNYAYSLSTNPTDTFYISFYKLYSQLARSNNHNILNLLDDYLSHSYPETQKILCEHIAGGSAKYYKYLSENERLRAANERNRHSIIILSLILMVIAGIYLFQRFRKNKQTEINSLISDIAQLRLDIGKINERGVEMSNEQKLIIDNISESLLDGMAKINRISLKRLSAHRRLTKSKHSTEDSNLLMEEFFNDLSTIISELNKPKLFISLEQSLNHSEGNIMTQFRKDFPDLSEHDYCLITLIFSQIGNQTIYLLMKYPSAGALNIKKHRLKLMIEASSASRKEFYLKKFSFRGGN
ncbi:MAG: hypothetical protein HDS68_06930 [Bacteroidales bacterium]|nr:hypothetical protein [Bacteroidales bacterium]